MVSEALFHVVNTAGGLDLDPRLWRRHLSSATVSRRARPEQAETQSLSDAAEQLRRLARYADLHGTPSRLLRNALAIVERENATRARA